MTGVGRRVRPAVVAALGASALLTACGGEDTAATTEDRPVVGNPRAGSVAQYADCEDWRHGTEAERQGTIDDLRGQLTAQSSETAESVLSDEAAYRLFERVCVPGYQDSLRLYKLYVRAAAFAPLRGDGT